MSCPCLDPEVRAGIYTPEEVEAAHRLAAAVEELNAALDGAVATDVDFAAYNRVSREVLTGGEQERLMHLMMRHFWTAEVPA